MHRLRNGTQHYDWGSESAIPRFLREGSDGRRVAEVWIGTHPLSPSRAVTRDSDRDLTEIAGQLPFLLKVLAADRPLSLQVHPNRALAEDGFRAEEAAGIPLDAPHRTYKDANHKPEMVYALTTFDTLVGFRPTAEILRILAAIDTDLTRSLGDDLHAYPGFQGIVQLVERLLTTDVSREEIAQIVAACDSLASSGVDIKRAYATAVEVAAHHPSDPGVVISLLLNRLTLQPGEAAFLGTGVIHSHLSGLCLEVMATSDNVLRAGLTSKHVDPQGLLRCLERGMSRVARVTPHHISFSTELFSPVGADFALALVQASRADPDGVLMPVTKRSVLICTGGEVTVVNERGDKAELERGDSLYAGHDDGELRIHGIGEVAQAYEPGRRTPQSTLIDLV